MRNLDPITKILCILPLISAQWLSTLACLVFIAFRKFFFCIMTADFFVSTTEINVMIASLEKSWQRRHWQGTWHAE